MTHGADDGCTLECYACNRPKDAFGHVHLGTDTPGREPIAVCIPCLVGILDMVREKVEAYAAGGIMFDQYMHQEIRRHVRAYRHTGTPLPSWMQSVLEDIERARQNDD